MVEDIVPRLGGIKRVSELKGEQVIREKEYSSGDIIVEIKKVKKEVTCLTRLRRRF